MTPSAPQVPAPAPPPDPHRPSPTSPGSADRDRGPLRKAVAQHIGILQDAYHKDSSQAVQALARLRRGIGRQANETPDLWGLVGVEAFYAAWPEGRRPSDAEALRAERAAHVAVTLWALHQQSNRAHRMHVGDGISLGTAVRRLMSGSDRDEAVQKRLLRAGTSTTFDVLGHRLRELVVLLRKAEIPLDYGLLAEQLVQWQLPGGPRLVRQAWGRSFHAYRRPADVGPSENNASEAPRSGAADNEPKDQT
ncbi:type I-E CRISPR-associated protein Cse2/CasB [Streptomyces sp. NPDC048606]|uniref:type I-E CRISPR-associated protein Cse2/CasB n=1 Tax=Streptomyces sp. NPDC048606 TaxID=3154726 RepID=UPI00342D1EBD